jgi:mono/diheme cytochrome c family protein
MTARHILFGALLAGGLAGAGMGTIRIACGQPATSPEATEEGKRVFKVSCAGCHKWHGGGGGGYGGAALSLRKTQLTRDQIIEVVSCGRPGTGMPYFLRTAYEDKHCYGLTRQDLSGMTLAEAPSGFLRPKEIDAVADYVVAHVKGKGEPTYSECTEFFGEGSRVCDVYKTAQPSGATKEGG